MDSLGGPQSQGGNAPTNVQKLKYRIIYCSGEDQDYPVTELLDPGSNSRGWQSAKFCDYPQEIIIQFPQLVKLKQLQFLSHQSKIASRIELFTFLPSGQQALTNQIPLNEIEFKRLGYLSLDPNERSGFQARELKSVYVDRDSEAVLLKLIFHKCHLNNFNVFNQIGLIALNCIGEYISLSKQAEASLPSKSSHMSEHGGFDPETALQIRKLAQEKDIAVRDENFDLAKQIKETIDRLNSIGQQLTKLEEQKRSAIANEDFDLAKQTKVQIEQLRRSAFHPNLQNPQPQNPPLGGGMTQQNFNSGFPQLQAPGGFQQVAGMNQTGFPPQQPPNMLGSPPMGGQQMGSQPMGGQPMGYGIAQQMDGLNLQGQQPSLVQSPVPPTNNNTPFQSIPQGQQPPTQLAQPTAIEPVPEQQLPGRNSNVFGDGPSSIENKQVESGTGGFLPPQQPPEEEAFEAPQVVPKKQAPKPKQPPRQPGEPLNVDDMIIPTLTEGAGQNQMSEYPEGEEPNASQQFTAEELSSDNQKLAAPLINAFGEDKVKNLFAKTWQLREEGLNQIDQMLQNDSRHLSKADGFVNAMGAVKFTIMDKMANVAFKSMQLLISACRIYPKVNVDSHKSEFNEYCTVIMAVLSNRIGENLQKMRVAAEDAFMSVMTHPAFGVKTCLHYLVNDVPMPLATDKKKPTKKQTLTSKQIAAKYQHLYKMLCHCQFTSREQQIQAVKFAVKGIQHTQNDVRAPAYDSLGELYRLMGANEIAPYYEGIRQASLDALLAKFAEIDEGGAPPRREPPKKAAPKKETIETNIGGKSRILKKPPAREREEVPLPTFSQKQTPAKAQQLHDDPYGQEEEEDPSVCNFCGARDPSFNDETIDMHYWKQCPMLTQCWECEQVIEIQSIEEHLLEECPETDKYRFCHKCKTVYLAEEYEGHECQKTSPAGAVRCPLCSETVFPNSKAGWQNHVLKEKCPGNPRLPRP